MEFSPPELTPGEFTFGVVDLLLFSSDDSDKYQTGFSVDREGNPLFGFDEGDWQEGWYVIGIDKSCIDPIFIDLNDPDLPVCTAMTGMGHWQERLISDDYDSFLSALTLVKELKNRHGSSNNVPDKEAQAFMLEIQSIVGEADLHYWGMYIQLEERDIEFTTMLNGQKYAME
jgi:hypothetical protein